MILCHKCSGVFERHPGLNSCQCMSGYPRGFEEDLTLQEAATAQVKREMEWLALYVSQGRPLTDPIYRNVMERLTNVMKTSTACGHGTIVWERFVRNKD